MGPIDGPVAPLWVPFAAVVALPLWIFVCYYILDFLADIGAPDYSHMLRVDAPKWQRALSYALGVPFLFIAAFGVLGLGAVLVMSIGSIVTH